MAQQDPSWHMRLEGGGAGGEDVNIVPGIHTAGGLQNGPFSDPLQPLVVDRQKISLASSIFFPLSLYTLKLPWPLHMSIEMVSTFFPSCALLCALPTCYLLSDYTFFYIIRSRIKRPGESIFSSILCPRYPSSATNTHKSTWAANHWHSELGIFNASSAFLQFIPSVKENLYNESRLFFLFLFFLNFNQGRAVCHKGRIERCVERFPKAHRHSHTRR